MKKELEVFYDLACPYCYQGLMDLRNFLVYEAYFEKDLSIEDKSLLTEFAKMCGADEESVREVLNSNKYQDVLESANTLVWSELKFAAVPSYRSGERTVGSGGGVLVDIDKVAELLEE